jgi:hypothetical protein
MGLYIALEDCLTGPWSRHEKKFYVPLLKKEVNIFVPSNLGLQGEFSNDVSQLKPMHFMAVSYSTHKLLLDFITIIFM